MAAARPSEDVGGKFLDFDDAGEWPGDYGRVEKAGGSVSAGLIRPQFTCCPDVFI